MKKAFVVFILLLLHPLCFFSQEDFRQPQASVEKSVFGIQTGFLGIWAHHETKLSTRWALRTELGFDYSYLRGWVFGNEGFNYISGYELAPVLIVEPRYYYNLAKRVSKQKTINNNSGNFITLTARYRPDGFVISNMEHIENAPYISFIPKWGIRRQLGTHFNYETGIGVGYRYYLNPSSSGEIAIDVHARIGYVF